MSSMMLHKSKCHWLRYPETISFIYSHVAAYLFQDNVASYIIYAIQNELITPEMQISY